MKDLVRKPLNKLYFLTTRRILYVKGKKKFEKWKNKKSDSTPEQVEDCEQKDKKPENGKKFFDKKNAPI
jgi:hypothetical protein